MSKIKVDLHNIKKTCNNKSKYKINNIKNRMYNARM